MPIDLPAAIAGLGGNRRILERVLTSFLENVPAALAELRSAAADGDDARLRVSAHGLKGAAANIYAEPVRCLAEQLEQLVAGDTEGDVAAILADIEKTLRELTDHLEGSTLSALLGE